MLPLGVTWAAERVGRERKCVRSGDKKRHRIKENSAALLFFLFVTLMRAVPSP